MMVTKREKRACRACKEQGVECAPAPVRIIEKGFAMIEWSLIVVSDMPTAYRSTGGVRF